MRLKITFKRAAGETNLCKTPYFNSKTKVIINENEIGRELQTSEQEILNGIAVWLSEGSGWTVVSINDHYINTVVYNPLKGSSYIKLPPEVQNSSKGLINLQNKDNECFRLCHIRHLNPQEKYPQRIKK